MHKYLIIKTTAPSDSDYEMITDAAIQNTLSEYWQWAEESDVDIRFAIQYPEEKQGFYDAGMHVYAEFEQEQDYKDFVVQHMWQLPKTKLNLEGEAFKYDFA